MVTYQRHLFAKMGMGAENDGFNWRPAEPLFALLPIHSTLARTELAILEDRVGLLHSLSQFTLALQFLIGRMPSLSLFLCGIEGDRRDEK